MNAMDTANHAAQIDRAALHVRRAQVSASLAQAVAISRPETARAQSERAANEANRALAVLCDSLGAVCPSLADAESDAEPMQAATSGDALDLRALAALDGLDTKNSRALLAALEAMQTLANAVDHERGNVLPAHIDAGPSGTMGTDFAESVNELTLRLKREIFGGAGRD